MVQLASNGNEISRCTTDHKGGGSNVPETRSPRVQSTTGNVRHCHFYRFTYFFNCTRVAAVAMHSLAGQYRNNTVLGGGGGILHKRFVLLTSDLSTDYIPTISNKLTSKIRVFSKITLALLKRFSKVVSQLHTPYTWAL